MISSKLKGKKENGDLVIEINKDKSKLIAFIDRKNSRNYIYYISSKKKGDMKKMINYLIDKTNYQHLWFISPLTKKDKKLISKMFGIEPDFKGIKDVLKNYYKAKVKYENKKCVMLVCQWNR